MDDCADAGPVPYNCGVRGGIGLIGREDELAELDRFLSDAGLGALAVRGDAGVGKTALTGQLTLRAARAGWRVLRATGVEAEKPFTLSGLNQMMFGLRDEVANLEVIDRDILAPVFGADPVGSLSPMSLASAFMTLLGSAARGQPVLLVVDDAHWLDKLSATVLSAAGRRASHPKVRIVATYRPLSGVPFSAAGWNELELGPLAGADAIRIVDTMALPLSATSRQLILDVAAGNPLALEELPRCADQIDSWSSSLPLTDRLVSVFGGRLQQLEPRVRAELLRAALDGASANTAAGTVSRYTMTDVESAIELDLLAANPVGDIAFRHPLVRAAVIHQAAPTERRDAHIYLAQLYHDVVMRRATHLSAATITPDQSVADLLEDAAKLSIRRGGAAVAVDWLRRAADLSIEPARRAELRTEAAFVASQANRFDDDHMLATPRDADADSVTSVLTDAYVALYRNGEVAETHRRIVAALNDADTLDDATVLRLVKLLLPVTLYYGEAQSWQDTDDIVDRLADRLDTHTLLYRDSWGDVVRRGHTVSARLAALRDTVNTLEPWEVMRLGVTAHYVDRLADFRLTLQRVFDRERDNGAITNAMTMLHLLVLDQIESGDWSQAEDSIKSGLKLTVTQHNELFHYQFVAYDGLRAACAGDVDTARRCAAEVLGWAGPRRLGLLLGVAHRIPVLTALAEGDYEAAYAAATRFGAAGEFPPYSRQSTAGLLDLVEAAVHAGHLDGARTHVRKTVRLRLDEISPRLAALTIAVRAMTAPDDEAGPLYLAALAHPALDGFPFEQHRIRLAHGMWLRRLRRTSEARDTLALATGGFASLGARPWEARARSELRAAGTAVKRSDRDTVSLSAQERTIAELAAAGQSNKQIAAHLFLSPRTIGAHLYRIFPKLGVTNRAALGRALQELAD